MEKAATPRPAPRIEIDRNNPIPLHVQVQEALRRMIRSGALAPRQQMPTVQELARQCNISPQTVMRAYAELGRQGMLEGRGGSGTFVAKPPRPCTELLLPYWVGDEPDRGPVSRSTYMELVDGLRKGFGQGDRRFCLSHFDGGAPPAREVLEVCSVRRADSIVAFGSVWSEEYLANLSRAMPTVAVFSRILSGAVDAVDSDPCGAVRAMIERRLAAGARRFAYVGAEPLLRTADGRPSTYGMVLEVFRQVLRASPAETSEHIVNGTTGDEMRAQMAEAARAIPDGAVVLVITPSAAAAIDPEDRRFDRISYTESAATLEELRGKVSLAYCGLHAAAAEAARLAMDRRRQGLDAPTKRILLSAEVHEAGEALAASAGTAADSGPVLE